ncbi:hypothetical protein Pd630_LPD04983 [Rhodococcus opacus PD630]|nr:hypothetical protein Pd630_LPD04983 [Rhodococcus opacus PD630]
MPHCSALGAPDGCHEPHPMLPAGKDAVWSDVLRRFAPR